MVLFCLVLSQTTIPRLKSSRPYLFVASQQAGNLGRKSDAAFRMGGYRVLITRSSLARSVQENTVSLRPPLRLGSLAGSGGAGNPGDGTFQQ